MRQEGRTGRFDEVVGNGWTVLSVAADPRDVLEEEQLAFLDDVGANLVRVTTPRGASGDGTVVDLEGRYAAWFDEAGVEAVVIRPDFYVYGTARAMEELPRLVSSLRSSLGQAAPEPGRQDANSARR